MATSIITILTALTLVTMTFTQDSPPSVTFTVIDEQDTGIKIGSLANVTLNVPENERDSLRFSFLMNTYAQYFTLNGETGELFTMVKMDRESICQTYSDSKCELDFKIAANTNGQFYQTINVKVIIEDINDNAPMFPDNHIELKVSEGVPLGHRILLPSADDPDTGGTNGIQSYELDAPSDTFDLLSEKVLDGTFKVELVVKKLLDREVTPAYQVRIVAKDGGSPPKTGVLNVDIVVTDLNDNKPVFDHAEYNVSVEEGTVRGSTVLRVHAEDKDIGANGIVTYRMNERSPVQVLNDFMINETTGEIKVAIEKLVFQSDFHYSFIVEALDGGKQISQVYVYIYVTDTGNNPPKITLSLLSPGNIGFVNVSENSKIGYFVAHITVEDSDTGANGQVSCSVPNNNFFSVVKLEEEEYKVVVSNTLDREVTDLHNVTAVCSDQGNPPLNSSVSFLVRVTDFNDKRPEFEYQNYKAKIPENTMTNKVILKVAANDEDIGKNKRIHYEVRNQDKIMIDSITGVITAKPFFNREITPIVTFEVLAIDSGETPLTGTATVTLTIEDMNDNAPKFTHSSYTFEILENLNSGTSVNEVSAKDLDIGPNGMFTFSLSSTFIDRKIPFHIFTDGVIQSNRALDREEQSRYTFNVTVTDQGKPSLASTVPVTIVVNDVNDNRPNITFPTKKNKTATLYYPTENIEIVTQIQAHDIDAGENGTVRYRITKGNELGLFKVDEKSGIITVTDNTVVIEKDISIALLIEVRDNGAVSLSSTAELIVNVIYTNATYEGISSESSKFVVIVVVVVVVTILLSAVIIGVIFLLRTMDRKRKMAESENNRNENMYTNKQTVYIMNNTGESSTDFIMPGSDVGRKKKEVSFSLDDHDCMNNYQPLDMQVSKAPNPVQYSPEKVSLFV